VRPSSPAAGPVRSATLISEWAAKRDVALVPDSALAIADGIARGSEARTWVDEQAGTKRCPWNQSEKRQFLASASSEGAGLELSKEAGKY
jgi:hypothetical protein